MRLVQRIIETELAAHTRTVNVDDIGARSCVVRVSQENSTHVIEYEHVLGDGFNQLYQMDLGGIDGNESLSFGFNLALATIRFPFNASDRRRWSIDLYDDIIIPFGQVLWKRGNPTIAAGVTQTEINGDTPSSFRFLQPMCSSGQGGTHELNINRAGVGAAYIASVHRAGVLAGNERLDLVSSGGAVTFKIRSLGGVSDAFPWSIIGYF